MLGENVGALHTAQVTQNTAAHAGKHTHQQRQEHIAAQPGPDGHRRTVDGEDPQTDGVRHQQQCLPVPVIALGVKALPHQKHQQGRSDGHQCLQGVAQRGGRRDAQQQIPQDTAAHGSGHAHHGHAEQVHMLLHRQGCAGNGEGHRADQFKIKLKTGHRYPSCVQQHYHTTSAGKNLPLNSPKGQAGKTCPFLSGIRGEK